MASALTSSFVTKKTAIASSSLLALSAALAWSTGASATGTCGAPDAQNVVNCTGTSYPAGIDYSGTNAVEDLTINIGSFAGQNNAVTITNGFHVGPAVGMGYDTDGMKHQALYVGANVTITTTTEFAGAIGVRAAPHHGIASVYIVNDGTLITTGGLGDDGIDALASSRNAKVTVENNGTIQVAGSAGISASSSTGIYAHSTLNTHTKTVVSNTGSITSGYEAIGASSDISAGYEVQSTIHAATSVINSGTLKSTEGPGIAASASASIGDNHNPGKLGRATAAVSVVNSGAISTSGPGVFPQESDGIYAASFANIRPDTLAYATSTTSVQNSGNIEAYRNGITAKAQAHAYGSSSTTTNSVVQAVSSVVVINSGDISAAGSGIYASTNSQTPFYGDKASANASIYIQNSGKIAAASNAIYAQTTAFASAPSGRNTSSAVGGINNSGDLTTTGRGASALDIQSRAESFGGRAKADASSVVQNSGTILTTGDLASDIYVSAIAQASGLGANTANGYAAVVNKGAITTNDVGPFNYGGPFGAAAIDVNSYASALGSNVTATATSKVDNSGPVITTGEYSDGIFARSRAYANSDTTLTTVTANAITAIKNTGGITTSGNVSNGVYGASYAAAGLHSASGGSPYVGNATATTVVNNSGVIKTTGGEHYISGADGIYALASTKAYAFRYAYATSVVSVTNSGAITTSGADSDGIAAVAESKAYGAKGCIPCRAAGYSIARSYATVANSGAIKTSGDDATGISVTTSGYTITKAASASYDESAVSNSGAIATAGAHSDGISAVSTGVGAFRYFSDADVATIAAVNNGGAIVTSGDYSAGISAAAYSKAAGLRLSAAYATTGVTNTGAISTNGLDASDISAQSKAYSTQGNSYVRATNYVTNTGALTSAGANSGGILSSAIAYSTFPTGTFQSGVGEAYATSGVGNSGSITTSGSHADGIVSNAEALAVSYYYSHTAATATASNSGAITTTGDYSSGIAAKAASENITRVGSNYFSQAVAVTTVQNGGTISVSGKDAAGISAFSYADAFGGNVGTATATVNVINTGSISASAQYADGVAAISVAQVKKAGTEGTATATTYVANAGSITAKNGTGISAQAFSYDQDGTPGVSGSGSATASVLVKNGGTIVAGEEGIFAEAAFDGGVGISTISTTATVENTGSITVTGDHGTGIGILSGGLVAPGTATVVNAGTVNALGAEAVGVYVSAYTTTIINAAGGVIDASGAGGVGVRTDGPQSTVATYAGSTISGGAGVGAAGVYMHGVVNVIGNSGTITSANDAAIAMYAYAANVVKNSGTITGTVTMTTGAKGQNVLYNYGTWNAVGGDSSFTHGAGGGSNLVNEKGGTIVVVGSQTFEGLDTFTNLGLVTMTQAASANLGSRPAFETLTVSGDYDGVGGVLAMDASTAGGMQGDELVIDGAASGTTKIMPTIVGTPGATTGNGILLVSAHAAAGASNFVLAGNAANGDEVAGAFEYNLAFDPGNGSSGKWYLQSQLYPGVYQFGQVQSAAALVSDQVNPSLDDLMSQAFSSTVANASLVDTSQQVASNDPTFVPAPNGAGLSGWSRFDEARFNVDPTGSPFADYKLRVDSMQIGLDGTWHNAGNLVMFGGYITPFHAWSDFASFGGHIGMSGTAYGLYGLWFSGPWQAGLRLNIDDATAHFTDTFIGTNASVKPYEKGAQAAVSYDMPLDWADFTPSAEFNYGTVNGVHFTDGAGDLVQLGSTDDVWGKLNGRFSWDVETAHNLMVQPYVNLGLLYRGDSSTRTVIGAFATSTNVNGWDGDLAVGVNTNLAANLSLSAQADYLAGDRVKGWTGFIGLRYTP